MCSEGYSTAVCLFVCLSHISPMERLFALKPLSRISNVSEWYLHLIIKLFNSRDMHSVQKLQTYLSLVYSLLENQIYPCGIFFFLWPVWLLPKAFYHPTVAVFLNIPEFPPLIHQQVSSFSTSKRLSTTCHTMDFL